jgi:L-alanine-DL-glutamate epimerase-like enolase superfamily enzyme
MRIGRVETRSYVVPLDPPFEAAWDPVPRDRLEETITIVHADDGSCGFASGAPVPDAGALERLLKGVDPLRTEVVRRICETVDFHGGRPWSVEVAVWDLVGRTLGVPLWRLLGGRSESLIAYASSGERVEPDERVRRVLAMRDAGVRAVKIRFHDADWRRDVEVVERVRDAVGAAMELMVDANHGWRMAGDQAVPWDVATATGAPGLSSRWTSTGSRSRCRRRTWTATRRCVRGPRSGWRRGRWCGACTRHAT